MMLRTLDRFVGRQKHIYFYEPHIFAPINKAKFKEMCQKIDYRRNRNVIVMSLWFNWLNLEDPMPRFEHQSVFNAGEVRAALKSKPVVFQRHLTYNDSAFAVKEFREELIRLVTMDEFE